MEQNDSPKRRWIVFAIVVATMVAALAGCSAGEPESAGSPETVMAAQTGKPGGGAASTADANDSSPSTHWYDESSRTAAQSKGSMTTVAVQTRKVVRSAKLTVRVADVEKAEREVTRYVASIGGFVSNSDSNNMNSGTPTVTLTARVPVTSFDSSLEKFESMGRRLEKKVTAEDVTAKLVDYEARLKTMKAQEESFRNMLRTSSRSAEALDLQTRLMNLREDIESIESQRKALADIAQLSTVELTLVNETLSAATTQDRDWVKESWNGSTSVLSSAVQGAGSLAIFVGVTSPIWLPFAVLVWWLVKKGGSKSKPVAG